MEQMTAAELIKLLSLEPLPGEGGYYRETYRSSEFMSPGALHQRYISQKSMGTAIYYLLTPDTHSALHRLPSDEIYHFYLGDPVLMLLLHRDGRSQTITLGPDLAGGQQVQAIVPEGTWQGSMLMEGGRFALMGTTMAPGFDFSDFEAGEAESLIQSFPEQRDLILKLI